MILFQRCGMAVISMCCSLAIYGQSTCLEPLPNPFTSTPALSQFDRWIDVLGVVDVFGESGVSDEKLAYVASITAELLDANEDGVVDHFPVGVILDEVNTVVAVLGYWGSPAEDALMEGLEDGTICASAVLTEDEVDGTVPGYWGMDATVEEVLHVLHHCGYVPLYPDAFDIEPGSSLLTEAMDVARGGQYTTIPNPYPDAAWYHYDDETCDYGCMAVEYIYWVTVSYMGLIGDAATCEGISDEWEPCTPELLESMDALAYLLLTDTQYNLPVTAPDGMYCPMSVPHPVSDSEFTAWQEGDELVLNCPIKARPVVIYTLEGRMVYEGLAGPTGSRVSLAGWARGTYVLVSGPQSIKVLIQ